MRSLVPTLTPRRLGAVALVAGAALSAGIPAAEAAKKDTTPPKVRFTSPTSGPIATTAAGKKPPRCQVVARDARGVRRVEFFVGPKAKKGRTPRYLFIGERSRKPYRCKWNPRKADPGTYTIYAKAVDRAGNESWDEVDVRVTARATAAVTSPTSPQPTSAPAPQPEPAPAPAPRSGRPPIGISASLRYSSGETLREQIAELRAAGMEYSREDFNWSWVEPRRGQWDWSRFDELIGESARQGLRIIPILNNPPEWATGSEEAPPKSGSGLEAYAEYARRAVERYGHNGTFWAENPDIPRQPVEYWDVWNEPYIRWTWNDQDPHGGEYARMYKAAVVEARKADSQAKFMFEAETGANTGRWPQPDWFAQAFDAVPDLARYIDAVSVHPYSSEVGPTACNQQSGGARFWEETRFQFCRVKDIRRILDQRGARDAELWITEMGWTTDPEYDRAVSESQQATYTRQAFQLMREWDIVDGLIWYHLRTNERVRGSGEDYWGLTHANGDPKPAWHVFVDEVRRGI